MLTEFMGFCPNKFIFVKIEEQGIYRLVFLAGGKSMFTAPRAPKNVGCVHSQPILTLKDIMIIL